MPRFLTYLSQQLRLTSRGTASRPVSRAAAEPAPRVFDLAELEDRILLSAAPVPLEVKAEKVEAPNPANATGDNSAGTFALVAAPTSDANTDAPPAQTVAATPPTAQLRRELVTLDAGVENVQRLLAQLLAQDDPVPQLEVVLLDTHQENAGLEPAPATGGGDSASALSSAVFDPTTGRLNIYGNAGDNTVQESFTPDGFLSVTLDGLTRSAQPFSPFYDPALAGASASTLRAIVMSGGGGHDSLTLGNQSLDGGLTIQTDGDLIVAGSVRVTERFLAEAATIELAGSITAPGSLVTLHGTSATLVAGSIDVTAVPGGVGGRAELLGPRMALRRLRHHRCVGRFRRRQRPGRRRLSGPQPRH